MDGVLHHLYLLVILYHKLSRVIVCRLSWFQIMRSPYGPHRKNYDWLGLTWNTEKGSLKGIERRVSTILACIYELKGKLPYMTARQLAGFVGRIISLIPVTWLPVMLLSSELDF